MPDFRQVKDIFLAAVEKADPNDRESYLRDACGDDGALRRRVDALLRRNEQPGGFLEQPPLDSVPPVRDTGLQQDSAGTRLGPYKLLEKIGEGGMGAVWSAEQEEPVRRRVAVKLIRAGLDGGQTVARFEAERQALALMNHPNIAPVLDGGATADGRPYLVMELIQGTSVTLYCDEHRLTVRQRLELFVPVCRAIQHAHQKGIIHRDIKPSNVLVAVYDGKPVVKVIDFGVAKAAGQRLTERTLDTAFGAVVGTLEYMSPEQAELNNQDIDTRSDVYSLGVLLYELLTGSTPLTAERRQKASLLEVLRVIREEEPPRPSTRLSSSGEALPTISAQRQIEPAKLRRLVRGELDWIVMKALEKERGRRYDTANGLARDVERYLNDETVEACPPSAGYRLRKFLRRYKGRVAAASGILAALVVGLIGTLIFAAGEAEQRRQAEQNALLADEKKNAALYQAYRAHLAAAGAALQNHDVFDAAHQLDAAPKELRDWEWRHLHSRLDDRAGKIVAEPGAALFLLHQPDGIQIGQLIPNSSVRLMDLDGRNVRTIPFDKTLKSGAGVFGESGKIRLSKVLPHGILLLGNEVPDTQTQLELARLARLSPDASCFATAAHAPLEVRGQRGYGNVEVYDAASGKRTALCVGHKTEIWDLTFSPDGTRIASADEEGFVYIWNTRTGTKLAECLGHASKVMSVRFRRDGTRLVTTSADGTVRQWDPASGVQAEPPFDHHTGEVLTADYSPDGVWVASGGTDRCIRLWRATGRQEVAVLHGHKGAVSEVAFTPDGKRLVSLCQHRILGWYADNTVGIWDVDLAGLPVLRGHTSYVYPVAFSPDGRWIASGGWDHTVRLWDAETGEIRAEPFRHPGVVVALAFTPDSRSLISGCRHEEALHVWNVATGQLVKKINAPGTDLLVLAVSPDGKQIAAGDRVMDLRILEMATGAEVRSLPSYKDPVERRTTEKIALAYSPDGRRLAFTGQDQAHVDVWDTQTNQQLARLTGHTGAVYAVAFSRDGKRLASAGNDRTIRLWDAATWECTAELKGHTDEVFALAFHPGGTRLASAGRDRMIWLWDLAKAQDVARLQGHTNYVFALDFSPDGKTLVSGSGDNTVRLWDTEPLAVRYEARRKAKR